MATYYATLPNQVPYNADVYNSGMGYSSMPPGGGGGMAGSATGFAFKKRFERIDWKKIASTDIESISRNLDFHTLQENIMNITFCNIESEVDIRMMDPNFIKLFKLAQLTIEYLLHSQDYLSELVGGMEAKVKKAEDEHEKTKKSLEKSNKDLSELKKECHKRKKMLMAQQQILQAGSTSYNKCPYCNKAFVNITFLQSHLARRHPESVTMYNSMVGSQIQQPLDQKIQSQSLPINTQAPVITNQPPITATPPPVAKEEKAAPAEPDPRLLQELESIKDRLRQTESQLVDERNARNRDLQKDRVALDKLKRERQEEMNRWKSEQREKQEEEIERMREMFMKELKETNEKYQATERAMEQLQKNQVKKSGLGELQDDPEYAHAMEQLNKQREEVAMQKERLSQQLDKVSKDKPAQDEVQDFVLESDEEEEESSAIQQTYQKQLEDMDDHSPDRGGAVAGREGREPGEMEAEDSEEELQEVPTGSVSMTTTGGGTFHTTTLGTTNSLSLSGTRNVLLLEQLKNNPKVLQSMKQQLTGLLDERLEQRGISKDATGLTNSNFQTKMSHLKAERQALGNKHHSFYDIRQQYATQVEQLSYKRLQEYRRNHPLPPSPKASPQVIRRPTSAPVGQQNPPKWPQPGQPSQQQQQQQRQQQQQQQQQQSVLREKAAQQGQPRPQSMPQGTGQNKVTAGQRPRSTPDSPQQQPRRGQAHQNIPRPSPTHGAPTQSGAPRPAPRAASPDKQVRMSTTLSTTGQSYTETGTSYTGTGTGSYTATHTSTGSSWEDGSEVYSDEDGTPATSMGSRTPRTPRTPRNRQQQQQQGRYDEESEESEDDWDDDDLSELDGIADPMAPRPTANRPAATPPPKGEKVANLTRSIEMQLASRGKKPAGGVSTLHDDEEDDDDSLGSLTEEEDETPRPPKPSARKTPTRASQHTDTENTNTYGTSLWGSQNKSRASKETSPGDVSDEDWDDSDLHTEDLQ